MLKVTARDFGPIIEGTVELKPLTVFVGPSNAGKSYMASVVYSLMQARVRAPADTIDGLEIVRRSGIIGRQILPIPKPLGVKSDRAQEAIYSWIVEQGEELLKSREVQFRTLPIMVQELSNEATRLSMRTIAKSFEDELQRIHGQLVDLTRRSNEKTQLSFEFNQTRPFLDVYWGVQDCQLTELRTIFDAAESTFHINEYVLEELQAEAASVEGSGQDWGMSAAFLAMMVGDILGDLFGDNRGTTFYLPAARSGIAQGHRIIASTLLRRYPTTGHPTAEIPSFSGVIADFMGHLLDMERSRPDSLDLALGQTIAFIERSVTCGSISLQESDLPYPEIYYEPFSNVPNTGKFSLNQTSSMVSELAPVILFLKYLVRPGDLLILEEPESHLHPAAQRQMARAIVRLVNAGVKVLITTHSDYFLNQLNNLLRISHAKEQWLERHGFEKADCLEPDNVSAYLFRWDDVEGGSVIEELSVRPDVGIDDEEFGKVVNDQYEETILVEGIPLK